MFDSKRACRREMDDLCGAAGHSRKVRSRTAQDDDLERVAWFGNEGRVRRTAERRYVSAKPALKVRSGSVFWEKTSSRESRGSWAPCLCCVVALGDTSAAMNHGVMPRGCIVY